jgi:hypothetical protein
VQFIRKLQMMAVTRNCAILAARDLWSAIRDHRCDAASMSVAVSMFNIPDAMQAAYQRTQSTAASMQ